jgi:deoxyadenosine/deoxycytidine kinase
LYDVCMEKTPRPALMIFLSATTDLLVERIRARKRDFELEIDPAYYGLVNAAYEEYFVRYPGKKLRITMNDWDFVTNPELYKRLASLVDGELNSK